MPEPSVTPELGRGASSGPPLPPGTLAGFAVAVLAVLLLAFFSYRSLEARSSSVEWVIHTLVVRERLEELASSLKEAESGQRGFLLVGDEAHLGPFQRATASLPTEVERIVQLMGDNPEQQRRARALGALVGARLELMTQTLALARAGKQEEALGLIRSGRGRAQMAELGKLVDEMEAQEQRLLEQREAVWREASNVSLVVSLGGCSALLVLIAIAGLMTSRDYRARQKEAWLRAGQMALGIRMQGEQRLEVLGSNVLSFLAHCLDAQVGALYLAEPGGTFRRFAGHALAPGAQEATVVRAGEGLLGQAISDQRPVHLRDVPEGYLPIASSLARGKPRNVLITPVSVDGAVQAVMELGFLHRVHGAELELLARAAPSIGVAVRSSKDRSRLEELLEETQRQAEELQTQQEELRVTNEELEEQSRALKESQVRLEAQHAELEQTNSQLEEQTQLLEGQKDELSRAQGVLVEKTTELARSNQFKSEFLANMSHELRTPLNSSLILAKLLADNKDGNLTPEQVRFAQTISSAGNDLLALINDILDLSRIEAGKMEVQPEPVSVPRAMDALLKSFQPVAQQKGLVLRLSLDPAAPEQLETDPQRLGQILKNLLSNALKFTQKGEVSLTVLPAGDGKVAFAVRDSGIGIPAHQHDLIFEAFRQADGSTHRKYGGTGLGLSISRDLARLLGGDITVQSAPDEGSTFILALPVVYAGAAVVPRRRAGDVHVPASPPASPSPVPASAPAAPALEDDRSHLSPAARLILIVEDDVRFAAILRDLAHELGFQCVIAHSAGEGLRAAEHFHPSAILLDMNLPDHSGLGVLDQLKRNPATRHIPVHVASVADHAQEALELGAVGYALKPVKRDDLVDAFRKLEAKFSQGLRRVLVVEDDATQRESIRQLLGSDEVEIHGVETAGEALRRLSSATYDCMVMDLNLPDLSGYELLEQMAREEAVSFPPVIVYTGRSLSSDEEHRLRRFSKSIIIKDARSPERLLDEVTLFLHQVESRLPPERQRMLREARDREAVLEGRRILVVEDDVRNIFALSSVLEPKGAKVQIARNGREALEALGKGMADLVLMDVMMPEMDGLTAMREIRKRPEWQKLPIIALTAKAMKDDQEKCLAAGANDYIAKPLDVEKLLSLVRVWMPKV